MYVVYHSSDSFAQVTAVSIVSLLENNKDMQDIEVFVIEHGISDENKGKIRLIANKYGRIVNFIPMPDINQVENLGLKSIKATWLYDSFCRLYLDNILPPYVDRVLYLDGDVLIHNSLTELWNTDLQGKCVAAVPDCIGEEYYHLFGLSDAARYCNSGVLLIDIKKWKDMQVGKKVANYVRERKGYVFFMEQTVLNAVLDSQIHILHPRYNVSTLMQSLSYKELMGLRNPKRAFSEKEFDEAINNPCLIHLTTLFFVVNRAWIKNNNHPDNGLYMKYVSLTPWKDSPLLPDARTLKKKFVDFFVQNLPRKFVLMLAGYLYKNLRVDRIRKEMKKLSA